MKYEERKQNLFDGTVGYYYAHCISADFALGAGIAVQFDKMYGMRNKLLKQYGLGIVPRDGGTVSQHGNELNPCILIDNVFNLVTKERYYQKPTLITMQASLVRMKEISLSIGINKIAMPRIGAGLDRLNWEDVRELIGKVFGNTDIEILVCYL